MIAPLTCLNASLNLHITAIVEQGSHIRHFLARHMLQHGHRKVLVLGIVKLVLNLLFLTDVHHLLGGGTDHHGLLVILPPLHRTERLSAESARLLLLLITVFCGGSGAAERGDCARVVLVAAPRVGEEVVVAGKGPVA